AANAYFTSTAGSYGFGIAGIDASGYDFLRLSFGYRKESANTNAAFALEYSTDGSTWTPVSVTLPATNAATGWYLIENVELPSAAVSATLSLRWVKSGNVAMRLDDVKLQGVTTAVAFVPGYENLAVAGTSQAVTGLTDNATYYFRVRAEGAGGCPSANSTTASVTTIEAVGGPQTIDFPGIGDQVATNVVVLSATASSGLAVSFAVSSGPAVLDEDGVTLSFTGAGAVSVVASQAGGGGWDPAVPATNTFAVTKAVASVTLNDLAQAYDGTARSVTATTVPAGLTVDVAYAGGATPPTAPGSYEVIGTVAEARYQGAATNTLTVSVAAPVSFASAASGLSAVELSFAPNAAGNAVVVVANATGTFGEPSGTPTVGETLAGGTVLYVGTASPQTHADLDSCTPYYYKAWSYVDGYYSSGLADDASTTAPDAPAGLSAVPDYTSFSASWAAVAGAAGYRLDVSTSATFGTAGAGGSLYKADFEDASKSSYVPGTVTNRGIVWYFNDAVVGGTSTDRKNGSYSVRIRSNETANAGYVQMNVDTNMGLSSVTLQYGVYGSDGASTGRVEYSTTSGSSWTSLGTFVANSTNLQTFAATNVNVTGNVRVRVVKTSGAGSNRMNVDDITLYPYAPETPSFVSGYENLAVAGTNQIVSGLAEGATYYFRVRAEGASCTSADSDVASTTTLEHLRPEISQAAVNVRENGEGRFFVRLNKDPGTNVVVAIARSAGDAGLSIQDGATRNFKSSNWSSWQTVTLAEAADEDAVAETATFQVSMGGADDQFVEATALDDDAGENLALAAGGSAISASVAYARPEQLIDGVHASSVNYGFVVCTSVPPGTITLDLKALTTVSRVRLLTWDWVCLLHRYTIESSTDGSNWTTLIDATGADHHGWDDWAVADVALRYLRFTGESTTQNRDSLSVAELEVYGTRDLSGLPQPALSASALNVREDGEGRFFLRLDKAPEGVVTVNVERDSGDENISIVGGATRTFKASNWDQWQAVNLAAADDADADGET
ncbi:MAG TPA: MBG domain-containing protein, partial [Kiritimatiellia bacterium]|nr:MBG domain-containing protein [Kiritimatiellia bacterium]